jgi:hypothetical protein
LAAFVNPYGWRLPWTWLQIMRSPHLGEIIQEHARLDWTKPEGAMVMLLALVYAAALLGTRPREVRVTWLLPLVWMYLACDRVRHAPLFGVAAALAIGEIFPHTRWAESLVRRGSDLFIPPKMPAQNERRGIIGPALLPLMVIIAAVVCQARAVAVPVLGRGWATLDPTMWPLALSEPLRQLPPGTCLFNELNLGGFVIYEAPDVRVFIDDRCELYGDTFLQEYDRGARREPQLVERWQREYGFSVALTQTGSALDRHFREATNGWQVVAECAAATLYRRDHGEAETQSAKLPQ